MKEQIPEYDRNTICAPAAKKNQAFRLVRLSASAILGKVSGESKYKDGADWETQFRIFFSSSIAEAAGSSLSENAAIAIHIGERDFIYRRKNGRNTVTEERGRVDVHFWVPEASLRQLLSHAASPDTGIGSLGVAVFQAVFHEDQSERIRFKVEVGFLELWSKGYFSVLKAGGPEVASYLARRGLNSVGRIREILQNLGR